MYSGSERLLINYEKDNFPGFVSEALRKPLELQFESGITASKDLYSWFFSFLNEQPENLTRISQFMKKVDENYQQDERVFIKKALALATVAHQYNYDFNKRTRKADRSPYILHPLSMAERLLQEKSISAKTFKWQIIAASLLHDVPEDCNLGPRLSEKDNWFDIIEREFGDSGTYIRNLIDGVTEKKLGPEDRDQVKQAPIRKMIVAFMERGGLYGKLADANPLTEQEKENVDEVVFNLQHTFHNALSSPEMLGIFLIKIADIWHNFQTPEYVDAAKVLRGRIAACLCEWFGWYSMRSEIMLQLASITDTNTPYLPLKNGDLPLPSDKQKNLGIFDAQKKAAPEITASLLLQPDIQKDLSNNTTIGWSLPFGSKIRQVVGKNYTTLPPPEIRIKLPYKIIKSHFENLPKNETDVFEEKYMRIRDIIDARFRQSHIRSDFRISSFISTRLIGRIEINYVFKLGLRPQVILTLEDDRPHLVDLYTEENQSDFHEIPEWKLFSGYQFLMKNADHMARQLQLDCLIGFMYDPNLPHSYDDYSVFIIPVEQGIIFAGGNRTFKEYFSWLGLPIYQGSTWSRRKQKEGELVRLRFRSFKGTETHDWPASYRIGELPIWFNSFSKRIIWPLDKNEEPSNQ